jgi:hypothetical protein
VLPAPRDTAGVSILTELATRLVEAGGTFDADAIEAANETIRAALAPEVADLLTPPTLVDGETGPGDLDDSDAGRLAARLGALAALADGDATPALTILQQLADDVADGTIDGQGEDGALEGLAYDPATFEDDFVTALRDFAAAFGDDDLQGSTNGDGVRGDGGLGGANGGSGGGTDGDTDAGTGGDGFVTEPATVNGEFVGTFTLVYFDGGNELTNDPFADEQEVEVTITGDGTLTIDDVGPLSDPFLSSGPSGGAVNPAEIIWEDPATGLFYALSNNESGVFNEINVGDPANPQASGFPGFLGQIREPEDTSDAATVLGGFAANSNLRIVRSCSESPSRPDCPTTDAVGETLNVIVSNAGVIQVAGFTLDPADGAAEFSDFRTGSIIPRVELAVPGTATDTRVRVHLHPAQFPGNGPPFDAIQVNVEPTGSGSGSSVYAEYPQNLRGGPINDYFQGFPTTPVELVYVADDVGGSYNGKGNTITSAPFGVSPLCRSFEVAGVVDPTEPPGASTSFAPQFAWIGRGDRIDAYESRVSRFQRESGGSANELLSFNGGQFQVFESGTVTLEEGLLDNSTNRVASVRDKATSDASEIAGACGDFVEIGGTITVDVAGSVTLSIDDTTAGAEIYDRTFVLDGAGSVTWDELLPGDLAYEITATGNTESGAFTCTVNGATGTLTTTVADANVNCTSM